MTPAYVDLRYANGFAVRWGAGSHACDDDTGEAARRLARCESRIPNHAIPAFTS